MFSNLVLFSIQLSVWINDSLKRHEMPIKVLFRCIWKNTFLDSLWQLLHLLHPLPLLDEKVVVFYFHAQGQFSAKSNINRDGIPTSWQIQNTPLCPSVKRVSQWSGILEWKVVMILSILVNNLFSSPLPPGKAVDVSYLEMCIVLLLLYNACFFLSLFSSHKHLSGKQKCLLSVGGSEKTPTSKRSWPWDSSAASLTL